MKSRPYAVVEAVAITLPLLLRDAPNHERRAQEIFAEECPDIPVSISYEVLPKVEGVRALVRPPLPTPIISPSWAHHLGAMRTRLDEKGSQPAKSPQSVQRRRDDPWRRPPATPSR